MSTLALHFFSAIIFASVVLAQDDANDQNHQFLRNAGSGCSCIDQASDSTSTRLFKHDTTNQHKNIDLLLNQSMLKLKLDSTGNVLDVERASREAGKQVLQWPFHGGKNQLWTIHDMDYGYKRIQNLNSGLYLALNTDGKVGAPKIIQKADDVEDAYQLWELCVGECFAAPDMSLIKRFCTR